MKKFILVAAIALGFGAMSSQAQTVLESKFFDNWSFTLKGGMTSPLKGHGFWGNSRGIAGVELRKQITPIFGLGVEGEATVNTSSWKADKSANMFDDMYVGVFGTINLNNLFAGYAGAPRFFEIEAVAGTGWLHSFYNYDGTEIWDGNSWATKVGLNFNFNLGEAKAWTIALKPALVYNMNPGCIREGGSDLGYAAKYDANHAYVELEAGVTYHFKNSNGTHSFVIAELRDEAEIAALNSQINALRDQLNSCDADKAALEAKINALQAQLNECLSRPAVVKEVVKNLDNVRYVFFRQSSSTIDALQQPNVEMIAQKLKNNENATVEVKGYASPEGSKAFNEKLAQKRADSVKKVLVNKYDINADRINAVGCGIGDTFSQKNWNRCAICTVNE